MLPKSVGFWGASSVYGHGDLERGGYVSRFREWYDNEGENGVVYQLGIPAENTDYLVSRFPFEFDRRNPELVFLHIGANDSFIEGTIDSESNVPLMTFRKNIVRMIESVNGRSKLCFILQYPIDEAGNPHMTFAGKDNGYYNLQRLGEYIDELQSIAKEYDIDIVNVWDNWIVDDRYKEFLSDDGLHMNPAGHEYLAQQIIDYIESRYL